MDESQDERFELLAQLETACESGSAQDKVAALKAIRFDPLDEGYEQQRLLASEGLVEVLVKCLSDEDSEVVCEAALCLAALTANSKSLVLRLEHGKGVGFSDRADRLIFNPVQGALEEANGIRVLVSLSYSESSSVQEAAQEALTSAGSYNHDVKLAHLKCLVHDLREGKKDALPRVDRLISTMEIRDYAAVVLDQAILPIMKLLEEEDQKLNAVTVLGTISEERPAAGAFLCDEGALKLIAQMIISGEPRLRDAGVNTMWQMIRKNKNVLHPSRDLLGIEASSLVQPLVDIIHSSGVESDAEEKSFDNSDEALLILKALAEQDPTIRENVKELDLEPSRCSIM